jgi:hypothetical protein
MHAIPCWSLARSAESSWDENSRQKGKPEILFKIHLLSHSPRRTGGQTFMHGWITGTHHLRGSLAVAGQRPAATFIHPPYGMDPSSTMITARANARWRSTSYHYQRFLFFSLRRTIRSALVVSTSRKPPEQSRRASGMGTTRSSSLLPFFACPEHSCMKWNHEIWHTRSGHDEKHVHRVSTFAKRYKINKPQRKMTN